MKIDIAVRLAAAAEEKVTIVQAGHVVQEFLDRVRRCPVCLDKGEFTFSQKVKIDELMDRPGGAALHRFVEAGTRTVCPHCGGSGLDGEARGDPEFVAWHCAQGDSDENCWHHHISGEARHASCGYRVILPFSLPAGL